MEELIKQMRAELYGTSYCTSDFEKYDAEIIKRSPEPFFWMVREHGTTLLQIGPTLGDELSKQSVRLELMRDRNAALNPVMYWNEPYAKYFYYDGWKLCRVEKDDVATIYNNVWGAKFDKLASEYPDEYEMCNEPLELRMAHEGVETKFKQCKEIARDLHDPSFMDCFNRLKKWRRVSTNQYMEICNDFATNSFTFSEIIDGNTHICGGIIYHPGSENNRWQIHT